MNEESNKALLKLEMSVWVKKRAKNLKCSEKEVREYLAIEVMKCGSAMSVQNIMYGQVWPVPEKHAIRLNRATGIKLATLNPDVWARKGNKNV